MTENMEVTASRKNPGRPRGYIKDYRPQAKTRALLFDVEAVLDEYMSYWPLTCRQIFYRLVSTISSYPKTEAFYGNLCHHLANARRARLIPFYAIRDDGETTYNLGHFDDEEHFLRHVRRLGESYTGNKLAGQDLHLEVWCEAAGMAPQLFYVAEPYSIPVYSSGGFDSLTSKKRLANRICEIGKRAVILHLGDHDPSGQSIFDSVAQAGPQELLMTNNNTAAIAAHMIATAVDNSPAGILDTAYDFLGRFVAYPSEAAHVAHVLWVAHAHFMGSWETTPRIAFLSPEPGSGKTRALEISELLCPRPINAVNMSPAALFRLIGHEDGLPTILFDEIDTVFGPKAKENEELRGLLNAGYRRGAKTYRCVVHGKQVGVEEIEAFSAVALAGLGDLPDTILSRSVIVKMRRRAPHEQVEPYRRRLHGAEGEEIRDLLAQWAATVDLADTIPDMPDGIVDRDADVWEALLAVADAAGCDWPERGRVAAVALVASAREGTPSLGVQLLADLRKVFGESDALATISLLDRLHNLDESPWADIRGKPLDERGLSRRLAPYGIKPKKIRIGTATPRGYTRTDMHDTWVRYLPPIPEETGTNGTSGTGAEGQGHEPNSNVPAVPHVPLPQGCGETEADKPFGGL